MNKMCGHDYNYMSAAVTPDPYSNVMRSFKKVKKEEKCLVSMQKVTARDNSMYPSFKSTLLFSQSIPRSASETKCSMFTESKFNSRSQMIQNHNKLPGSFLYFTESRLSEIGSPRDLVSKLTQGSKISTISLY